MSQKGGQAIAYMIFTFEDGATIVVRNQRLMTADKPETLSAQMPGEIIKGTGRFEGIKGTTSATGKNFVKTETEPTRIANDVAFTYTLPGK